MINRPVDRFLHGSPTVRGAARVVMVAILASVFVGGFVVYLFDRKDFPDLGLAFWWALQTVTTVGYGDIVPTSGFGKVIGAVVMVVSIAILSIITASITSIFVDRTRREREIATGSANENVRDALMALTAQVAELEATVRALSGADPDGPITSGG